MNRKPMNSGSIELAADVGSRPGGSKAYNDADSLARLGKAPVFKRKFGFVAILSFSLLVLSTWLGGFTILGVGLANGGPAGLIYQFIIVWVGNLATFTTLAELASIAPTAGGQYYWVAILAPARCQKILSYVTGWLTVCGWQAGVAASGYVCALFLQGFIQVVNTTYVPQLWHSTLLMYGALLAAVFATTVIGRYLPIMESILLVIYVLGFFAVIVPLVYLGPHVSAKEVFTTFLNEGNWPTMGVSFFVGISGNAFAFLGADSVYHMSEEVKNASTTVPTAMVWGLILNGVIGLASYIAILFTAADIGKALKAGYVYPFIALLLDALNSRAGVAIILGIMIVVDLGLLISVVAASSRMLWSFARDRGVPFWSQVVKVNSKSTNPNTAIVITIIISFLLGLISVGSPTAFYDAISLTIVALYASYFMACALLLYRRLQGSIDSFDRFNPSEGWNRRAMNIPGSGGRLTWGPWRVREPFGTIINMFACAYLIVVWVFSFFPPATPVTAATMNYSCLVMGFVMIASIIYYYLFARRVYEGPVIDEAMHT